MPKPRHPCDGWVRLGESSPCLCPPNMLSIFLTFSDVSSQVFLTAESWEVWSDTVELRDVVRDARLLTWVCSFLKAGDSSTLACGLGFPARLDKVWMVCLIFASCGLEQSFGLSLFGKAASSTCVSEDTSLSADWWFCSSGLMDSPALSVPMACPALLVMIWSADGFAGAALAAKGEVGGSPAAGLPCVGML